MSAVPLLTEIARASPAHPSATMLSARIDAAKLREAADAAATGYRRARAPEWLLTSLAPVVGLALFVALWAILAKQGGRIPDPATVFQAAVKIFADPFYSKGPN